MKIIGDSVIYKIDFSQTKNESHYRVRTHVKMRDHTLLMKHFLWPVSKHHILYPFTLSGYPIKIHLSALGCNLSYLMCAYAKHPNTFRPL